MISTVKASNDLCAYCLNNPVNNSDSSGNLTISKWAKVIIGIGIGAIALTAATGGAVAFGIAKIVGSVILSTASSATIGYFTNGKQGAIDGACNGFMWGSLSSLAASWANYIFSPAKGIDTYKNLRSQYKGSGKEVHHILKKRFAKYFDINDQNNMLSIALTKEQHLIYTNKWRINYPYVKNYNQIKILYTSVKVYWSKPSLLVSVVKTILFKK